MKPTGNDGRYTFEDLVAISKHLLSPEGCPWDREQTIETLRPYLVEECYEVLEAINAGDGEELAEELGDLLFQVVFQGNLAETHGFGGYRFDVGQVVHLISEKLVRRHPHVFGDVEVSGTGEVLTNWEAIKAAEKPAHKQRESLLDGVPAGMPGLPRAQKLTRKAAKVGFDWPSLEPIFNKLEEEIGELREALQEAEQDRDHVEEELGDVLFVVANIARHLKLDGDSALQKTNRKFIRRFQFIERTAKERGIDMKGASLEELDRIYEEGKAAERGEAVASDAAPIGGRAAKEGA